MIQSYRVYSPLEQERTMRSMNRSDLARARDEQATSLMPRSANSWAAEQQRLGSWRSGQGSITPSGVGNMYQVGQGPYTPVGMSSYTEVGRSTATVEHQRATRLASSTAEEQSRWRR